MNERQIRVCALMPYPFDTTPSQRFRIEQWQPFLENEGILIEYFAFTDERLSSVLYKEGHLGTKTGLLIKALLRRISHVFAARKYDAVFVHRGISVIGPAFMEKLLRLSGARLIFDFDDSIFLPDTSNANKLFGWLKFTGKTAGICRLSSAVTVGNSYLAGYAQKYNENVYIIPTSIDTEKYRPNDKNNSKNKRVVVGWTGSSTSQYHLEMFEPILAKLLMERDVEIRVISNREPSFEEIDYEWRSWSAETEIEEISQIDIGIMPTPDDDWSRGKCALKALQYMSLGIPAVCSNVGANREVVKHGKNGFLAKTPDEWLDSLKKLIDDKSLRKQLGNAARKTVVENYSMEICAQKFGQVVLNTVNNKQTQG